MTTQTTDTCQYNLQTIPAGRWSGCADLPEPPVIGHLVDVRVNRLGVGTVVSYFVEHGFVGVCVRLHNPPDWHIRQTNGKWFAGHALVFGAEVRPFMV